MTAGPKAITPSLNGWNADYVEAQYLEFKADPTSVSPDLRAFFQGFDLALARGRSEQATRAPVAATAPSFQSAIDALIAAYRRFGHMAAKLDPFGRDRPRPESMTLGHWGLTEADLDQTVHTGTITLPCQCTLRQTIEKLERAYCGSVGLEYAHVQDTEEREWLIGKVEQHDGLIPLSDEDRIHALEQLTAAEAFDNFLAKRYPGEKRFSISGAESLIPLLDHVLEAAADSGVVECVMGMAHRGRLSVLNNVLGKTCEQIFTEFEDTWTGDLFDEGGDVKYHRGYSGDRLLRDGKQIRVVMASNPSHLESADPVVLGRCRAKQRLYADLDRRRVIPLLIHGDAAIAGQGMVAEVLNLSQLEGYTVGGTIHVVVNNHIGFTTAPKDSRTSRYCTDVAKMIEAPIFHVNGEDPEAVLAVAQFAMEYRQRFKRDVVIDMWCYRRFGHNEQDEMSFTQPVLAGLIRQRSSTTKLYALRLFGEGVLTEQEFQALRDRLSEEMDEAQATIKEQPQDPTIDPGSWRWQGFDYRYTHDPVETAVTVEMVREVCEGLGRVPEGFTINPKLKHLLASRAALPETGQLNHADAELVAFGTLLLEGVPVRLSGQDSRRGTFSQRHAVFYDKHTSESYVPLNTMRTMGELGSDKAPGTIAPDGRSRQARLCVYDSALSEQAVLGFDYGYSLADPNMLVLWEAQFGDFINGAQVIIDQFIASAEIKWERWSGLVMLLPHGYEGAGPEHSSARLERFLQLCGDDNIQVVYPSTGAQHFHLLRRQVKRQIRKPLIVMTPKSMLRVPTSRVEELSEGRFHEVLDDPAFAGKSKAARRGVKRVVLCTGKIYHELAKRREVIARDDLAIIRVEQLYPLHSEMLLDVLGRYPKSAQRVWVQEEPRNMGAFSFMYERFTQQLGVKAPEYIGRAASGSPAAGSKTTHRFRQESIISQAVGPLSDAVVKAHA